MDKLIIFLISILLIVILSECDNKYKKWDSTVATIKGTVKGIPIEDFRAEITVSNSVTGERITYTLSTDLSREFELKVPVAFDTKAGIDSKYTNNIISLSPGKTSYLYFDMDNKTEDSIKIVDNMKLSTSERITLRSKIFDIIMNSNTNRDIDSVLAPEDYKQHMIMRIDDILSSVDTISTLSDIGKKYLKDELNVFYIEALLMGYKDRMNSLITQKNLESKEVKEPDLAYYSFLRKINLSDTSYISSTGYHLILDSFFKYSVFGIKPIDEIEPSAWVTSVKATLDNILGNGQQLFYNLLLANSYGKQLSKMKPFSKKQIKNIEMFYKDDNIGKTLLSENHKVNILLKNVNKNKTILALEKPEMESLPLEQAEVFMKNIFDTYPNKVIVIAFGQHGVVLV